MMSFPTPHQGVGNSAKKRGTVPSQCSFPQLRIYHMPLPIRIICIASLVGIGGVFLITRTDQGLVHGSPLTSGGARPLERHETHAHPRNGEHAPRASEITSQSLFVNESQQIKDAIQSLFTKDLQNAELLESSLQNWALKNPDLARKLVFLLLEGSSVSAGILGVEKNWLPAELDLAIGWINALPEGDLRSTWINQLGRFYVEVNPERALALIPDASTPAAQQEFIVHVMARWAEIDSVKASQHLATMPAGAIRDAAEKAFLSQICQRMPAAAAAYVASEMTSESAAQEEATRLVVTHWSHLDPSSTAQWLGTFPPSALRAEMIGVLMPTWAEKDSSAAIAWSQSMSAVLAY